MPRTNSPLSHAADRRLAALSSRHVVEDLLAAPPCHTDDYVQYLSV